MSLARPTTLWSLLLRASQLAPDNGIIFQDGGIDAPNVKVTYKQLIATAAANAKALVANGYLQPGQIIGTYFTTHRESVEWCWSVLAAGGIPFIVSPLSDDPTTLTGQLANLSKTFEQPTILTSRATIPTFQSPSGVTLRAVETLSHDAAVDIAPQPAENVNDLALLLLTSGSTGHSKGVRFTHSQLLASAAAKVLFHKIDTKTNYLTWISFDHSASFCEMHLCALYAGANQYHIATKDVVTQPDMFLYLLSEYRISYSFLPNFMLKAATESFKLRYDRPNLDLTGLQTIITGGEANRTAVIDKAEKLLTQFGAPKNCIKSVYGLSETCSAAFYNAVSPGYDLEQRYLFASVGTHLPEAISMRIVDEQGLPAAEGSSGAIHVRGPIVFQSYHNNPSATADCTTADGWFDTGDIGTVDSQGHLLILGRKKDVLILNGNNYSSFEIENAIEAACPGISHSYTATFPVFDVERDSERVVVLFSPLDEESPAAVLAGLVQEIDKAVLRVCHQRAIDIVPLPKQHLPKSTIGKLSRSKLRVAYQDGLFDRFKVTYTAPTAVNNDTKSSDEGLSSMCSQILDIYAANANVPRSVLAAPGGLFNAGVDSLGYMRIKKGLEMTFTNEQEIPMSTLMSTHSVTELESALCSLGTIPTYYEPIVPLVQKGNKLPLFLFHPGAGEFLCWVPIIKYLADRPLYAIRAKGMNKSEGVFGSLDEIVDCYKQAIKRTQPNGPYAFLGYCVGGTLAFEVAKRLEAEGEEMAFISGIDNPPDVKQTLGQLQYRDLMIDVLPLFSDTTPEGAKQFAKDTAHLGDEDFYDAFYQRMPPEVIQQMDLTPARLARWGRVEDSMRLVASRYMPDGKVSKYDVFAADPMPHFNATPAEWRMGVLPRWSEFLHSGDELRVHPIEGDHLTAMKEPNIEVLQRALNKALTDRGI
ncbi:hypothetical protein MY10362_009737 [Beauveria mimosiformis]